MKRKAWQIITLIFPLLFCIYMLLLRKYNFYVYERVGLEDNILEWTQFFLYFLSGIFSVLLAFRYKRERILLLIYILFSAIFFFIAFEEISWGERGLGNLSSVIIPTDLMGRNLQGESNFHNIDSIHSKIGYIYSGIGVLGCFSWLGVHLLGKFGSIEKRFRKVLDHLVPQWYLFFYFFPLFINFLSIERFGFMPQDYELTETCLALGIFLFVIGNYVGKGVDDNGFEPSTPTM